MLLGVSMYFPDAVRDTIDECSSKLFAMSLGCVTGSSSSRRGFEASADAISFFVSAAMSVEQVPNVEAKG